MSGRFVLLGAAHWHASWHRDALERAEARIVAASDTVPERAEALLSRRPGEAFSDWRRVLDAHPDAIPMILLPPDEAAEAIMRCRAEGRAIMVEKPGTRSAAELEAAMAGSSTTPESVPFINRFASFWSALISTAAEGSTSDGWISAHFRILAGPPERYVRDGVPWVLDPQRFGGGALRNLGIHAADAIAQLVEPERLTIRSAQLSNRMHGLDVEDYAIATFETDDGRIVTLEAGYTMPAEHGPDKEWRVVGSGWAIAESNGVLSIRTSEGVTRSRSITSAQQYLRYGAALAGIAGGERQPADLHDLLIALRLVDRIYHVAGSHRG